MTGAYLDAVRPVRRHLEALESMLALDDVVTYHLEHVRGYLDYGRDDALDAGRIRDAAHDALTEHVDALDTARTPAAAHDALTEHVDEVVEVDDALLALVDLYRATLDLVEVAS